jgi:hypothetical protein
MVPRPVDFQLGEGSLKLPGTHAKKRKMFMTLIVTGTVIAAIAIYSSR